VRFQDAINAYKKTLERAMFAHQLISDMTDVTDIVVEKKNLLTFDERTLDTAGADKVTPILFLFLACTLQKNGHAHFILIF
jgi:hypothetical protein